MTNTKKQNYTFWELIKEFHIEIPIIQRDYAQGRKGNKTENIRLEFVKVLRAALLPDANKLHLNFVYGKVSSNKRFVPLDGQQRLTTLFLLHWYLAKMTGEDKMILTNFSYQTRPSSKDFCQALINEPLTLSEGEKLSEAIQDASWFFNYWEKDPTVEAMLNMLDTIQAAFKEDTLKKLQAYWTKLITQKQIHFEFLDLEKFNLTDELYVKMNARGKGLSPFENFKAWLMEYVENKENQIVISEENKDWKDNLDIKWADLFWNNKGDGNYTIDEAYMNFFRNMFQIFYVQGNDIIQKENRGLNEVDKVEKEDVLEKARKLVFDKNDNFISNDFYTSLKILDKCIDPLFKAIDVLAKHEGDIKIPKTVTKIETKTELDFFRNADNSVFKDFVSNDATYADKTRFYAMLQYLLHQKGNFDRGKFISWMRVFRNLINNSDINLGNFYNILKSIDGIANYSENIYEYSDKIKELVGFDGTQIKEEIRKANFIKVTKAEFLLLKFENHNYFKGRINFLLEMVCSEYHEEYDEEFIALLEEYGNKSAAIFTHKLKGDKEYLLERALLTYEYFDENCEYYIDNHKSYLIPTNNEKLNFVQMNSKDKKRNKIPTWKNDFLTNSEKLDDFRFFLDSLTKGEEIEGLREKIKNCKFKPSDWRYHIIHFVENIAYCNQGFIHYNSSKDILLLKESQLNFSNSELYSSGFFETYFPKWEAKEFDILPFTNFKYKAVVGTSERPRVIINKFIRNTYHYGIDIYFANEKYHLRFYNKNEPIIEDNIKEKLNELTCDFEYRDNCYFYENIETMGKVESRLLIICNQLIQFQTQTP